MSQPSINARPATAPLQLLIAGASRGIGRAVAEHRAGLGDTVWSVSRTAAPVGRWVEADLQTHAGCLRVAESMGGKHVDGLLYLGGTWETDAFTDGYAFERCSDEDLRRVLDVNLLAPIRLAQALMPALARAQRPRIVLMGALSGLPHRATAEVANTASKAGLQGVAQALAIAAKQHRVGCTVINPGNVATAEVQQELADGRLLGGGAIALPDLLRCIDLVLSLSASTTVERIDLSHIAA